MNSDRSERISPADPFSRMSDELLKLLRQRLADQYYDRPQVVEIVARAILHSRGVYA